MMRVRESEESRVKRVRVSESEIERMESEKVRREREMLVDKPIGDN
jgi:hypothetical protein